MQTDYQHAILFTGHMIDAPGRAHPRFPASAETVARAAIRNALQSLLRSRLGTTIGIAGGASGGDILFHESCLELGIPTRIYLALPPDQYVESSVAAAGVGWIDRFQALVARLGPAVQILDDSIVLAESGASNQPLNLWARTNLWMVSQTIALAPQRTLLALWDGRSGDGPGGTEQLVSIAPSLGIDVYPPIRTQSLLQSLLA